MRMARKCESLLLSELNFNYFLCKFFLSSSLQFQFVAVVAVSFFFLKIRVFALFSWIRWYANQKRKIKQICQNVNCWSVDAQSRETKKKYIYFEIESRMNKFEPNSYRCDEKLVKYQLFIVLKLGFLLDESEKESLTKNIHLKYLIYFANEFAITTMN